VLPKLYRLSLTLTQFPNNAFKRIENPFFRLYLLKTDDCRGTIIVSKKQVLKSSDRNLLKRRIAAPLLEMLKMLTGLSVVVWAKRTCLTLPQAEIKNQLQQALNHYLSQEKIIHV